MHYWSSVLQTLPSLVGPKLTNRGTEWETAKQKELFLETLLTGLMLPGLCVLRLVRWYTTPALLLDKLPAWFPQWGVLDPEALAMKSGDLDPWPSTLASVVKIVGEGAAG